jgi:hypothetical protein
MTEGRKAGYQRNRISGGRKTGKQVIRKQESRVSGDRI